MTDGPPKEMTPGTPARLLSYRQTRPNHYSRKKKFSFRAATTISTHVARCRLSRCLCASATFAAEVLPQEAQPGHVALGAERERHRLAVDAARGLDGESVEV